ncbi:carbohydrate ABC transporter permease [Alteribacillus sp. HJP-4]|uniref:carbohydrate ABC transporter permease n=1 Tax=Alteribacillus sp. HJP-4 TaxID=2775394 RepID=UPI0035CCEC55
MNSNSHTETQSKNLKSIFYSQKIAPYIFVSPFIITFAGFYLYPLIATMIMSFQEVLPGQTSFIGLSNYEKLFNSTFYTALENTLEYTFWTLIILIPIPMLLAIALNSKFVKFKPMYRAALFVPALTSTIVAGVIFRLMFAESDSAIANQFISFFGFSSIDWRGGEHTLMFLMVTLAAWRWMGVNLLYFLAGLQNVPKEMYEAAEIDGASMVDKFIHVTLPYLKPVTIYVVSITIFAGFRMFEEAYVFWQVNAPLDINLTLVGLIYREGFQYNNLGYGSAIGMVLLIVVFIISMINLKVMGAFKKD